MTITVARHWEPEPNTAQFAAALDRSIASSIDKLEESTRVIDLVFDEAQLRMSVRCTLDPAVDLLETWEATVVATQLGCAVFDVTSRSEGVVECRIADRVRRLPALGPQSFVHPGNWLAAWWLAIVCRDQARMNRLAEIPVDRLRSPTVHYDEYVYHWVDVLQTYWLERPGLVDKLIATIEATTPEVATETPRDLLDQVLYQPINLFYHFIRKDHAEFDEALADALELHKAYWTATEDRAVSPDGRIALGPLAIACLAHDAGFPIDVESDYLPKAMVQHAWAGEFDL
ncbi:immunity 49 family protein [Nocardia terpenica]|uniref:Immunity 49 family protein n=1 Tax=Nocardia terpenica TaxID=455432 RepID=A0A6G9YX52_9NOCA|nr:immunity 49 family protein [Nocardia terpenica]QIS17794.1 hypothetical protein F6W96_05180 [Nocardia terpenica]